MEERTMYVVIQEGGKQYRVSKGDTLDVEKLKLEPGQTFQFQTVMLYCCDEKKDVRIGRPILSDVVVTGEVQCEVKGEKVVSYKYKRRKGYHRAVGHRQKYTRLIIKEIEVK
jgi:large subunit ribosomal protein L21